MKFHSPNHDSLLQYQKHLEATTLTASEALNGATCTHCGMACSHHSGEMALKFPGVSSNSIFLPSSWTFLNNVPFLPRGPS